jgi:3-hydroxyacyl-[acyl-carrier-protein] dehydratase
MPIAAPLFDFDKVDLSREVVDRSQLDKYLRQANRFAMLDGVLHEDIEGKLMIGYKDIRADDWWTEDHIPGRPMFPGVLMIEAAAQLSAYDFSAHRVPAEVPDDKFVGFGGVDSVRFRGLVTPDCRLIIAATLRKNSRRMFRYETQGFVDQTLVFQSEIIGVIV